MKYIDSEKLIAEIERRIEEYNIQSLRGAELSDLLSFITSLQQEQPSPPSDLDEAAENYMNESLKNLGAILRINVVTAFKAGAKWVAGQGVTKEITIGIATEKIIISVSEQTLNELDLCPGNKVVVQIRKA